MKDFYALSALFLFIALMLMYGAASTVDEIRERDHYCQMVHDKAWPDFKHIYEAECTARKGVP